MVEFDARWSDGNKRGVQAKEYERRGRSIVRVGTPRSAGASTAAAAAAVRARAFARLAPPALGSPRTPAHAAGAAALPARTPGALRRPGSGQRLAAHARSRYQEPVMHCPVFCRRAPHGAACLAAREACRAAAAAVGDTRLPASRACRTCMVGIVYWTWLPLMRAACWAARERCGERWNSVRASRLRWRAGPGAARGAPRAAARTSTTPRAWRCARAGWRAAARSRAARCSTARARS